MKSNRLYFLLTFLVIAISGNPALGIFGKETIYIGTLIIFIVLWWFRPLKLTRQDVLVLALFVVLTITHVLSFGSIVVVASLGFLIKLCIALLAVRLIPEFQHRYVFVMYVLSVISFVFYIPVFIGVDMQVLLEAVRVPIPLDSIHYHIGIHNFREEYDGSVRNMGMFWEPGAFAGYLILALFFLIRGDRNKAVLSKQGFVLTATLLSTQSTTGYLALLLLFVFFAYQMGWHKRMTAKLVTIPLLLVGFASVAFVFFTQVSFLGEKINAQIASAAVLDDASRINRFGNFLFDLKWIADKPMLGWSASPVTRLSIDAEVAELAAGQGNGLTGFAVKFGLAGLLIFIGFYTYATRRITGSWLISLFGIALVGVLLNGEQFMNFPMFLSLMFMPRSRPKSQHLAPEAVARKHDFDYK